MRLIELSQGLQAICDDDDYEWLSYWKWTATCRTYTNYAYRQAAKKGGKRTNIYMHRLILGVSDPKILVDHIDRNGLNNRRENLRIADYVRNGHNRRGLRGRTSKYKGVHHHSQCNVWVAQIKVRGVRRTKTAPTEEEAARLYDEMARELHGEFMKPNFPRTEENE